jgi:hypothetical protein
MATLLTTDVDNPFNGTTVDTTLDDLQQAVAGGGLIELIYLPDSKIMVVDEEGLLKWLPINREASLLAQRPIVGDVVIANQDEID